MPDKLTMLVVCAIVITVFSGCENTDKVANSAPDQPTSQSIKIAEATQTPAHPLTDTPSSPTNEPTGPDAAATMEATVQPESEKTNAGNTNGPAAGASTEDKPYTIIDGKVDSNTYVGWQKYRTSNCGQCHGGSGDGGAASLVERLTQISKEQFTKSVLEGKGLMPPWKTNKTVVKNLDNIYAYLKARSDGILPAGKPQRIEP